MSESEQPPAEERKRPFQFGLRTLFVVTFIWAVFCTMLTSLGLGWTVFITVSVLWWGGIVYADYHGHFYRSVGLMVLFFALPCGLLPLLHTPRANETVYPRNCRTNLKQIGLALMQYESRCGSYPPAYIADESGKPMHSWRVLILPYLDRQDLYDKYDFSEPWDGPNNSKLHNDWMYSFGCPDEQPPTSSTDTSYVVVVGPNTMFPGAKAVTWRDVPDGDANTLMVVEVANSGIHWMEPRDLDITQMPLTVNPPKGKGVSSNHPDGPHAIFADGHVKLLDDGVTPKQLKAMLTRDGGEEVEVD